MGHKIYPENDDLPDLAIGPYWMGVLLKGQNDYSNAIVEFQASASYMLDPSISEEDISEEKEGLILELQELLELFELTEEQKSQVQTTLALFSKE
jgi:hypothetical protein